MGLIGLFMLRFRGESEVIYGAMVDEVMVGMGYATL
jgi:hypothetical protein